MRLRNLLNPLAVGSLLLATGLASANPEASDRYFVYLQDAGAVAYDGGIDGLRATATPEGARFDAKRPEVVAYRQHLASTQDQLVRQFEQTLGRNLEVPYKFDVLFSAIVAELSAEEAATLSQHPQVRRVEQVQDYELATDRGPTFIGADSIWNGTSTATAGYRGNGIVIGVLDTGTNLTHPSFANDASCGFSAANPKLVAAKNCLGSATCALADPGDTNGHGSHTASTAGGNTHIATGGALVGTEISGIAPCAKLITYKVCATSSCDGAAISAAIQTALVDQVDVINYSISGGTSPWGDADRGFLDLVNAGTFVAASAGNTNATITNPIGQVNHRGPWVMTVANSTHDRISKNRIDVAGGPQDVYGLKSAAPMAATINAMAVSSQSLGNLEGCTAGGAFPAGSMTGRVALISRGTCSFEEKIANAVTAGAIAVLVHNNNGGPPILMGVGAQTTVPSLMIGQAAGLAITAHLGTTPNAMLTIDATTVTAFDAVAGDVLNAGSLRGPIAGGIEVTKPDITAPGTNIMAAVSGGPTSYNFLSGTSMSGPHVAGSAALVMGLRSTWTVPEVKSAIMLTAEPDGLKDFTNGVPNNGPWDADDVGSGRVDLTKAARSGLVLHETFANFLAANGNPAAQRALNLASMRNSACTAGQSCAWTRTLRNAINAPSNWTVTVEDGPAMGLTVSPTTFSFTGVGVPGWDTVHGNGFETPVVPETIQLTVTANPALPASTTWRFAKVVLTENGSQSPPLRMTVAVRAQ
jgi:subtilisin family serine protease